MKLNIEVQCVCYPLNQLRGIQYYVINLVKALSLLRNVDLSISFFDQFRERNNRQYIDEYLGEDCLRNLRIQECNVQSYRTMLDKSKYINYTEFSGFNADLFHFPHLLPIPASLDGKMVVTIHDLIPLLPKAPQWGLQALSLISRHAIQLLEKNKQTLIIADSLVTKTDILELTNISADRVFVVPLACDFTTHYPEKNESALDVKLPYLLFVATLDSRKGVLDIINAFEQSKAMFGDLKLVLAGKVHEEYIELIEKLRTSPYRSDIIVTDFISDEQKRVLMSNAEIFLFPSEYEGFGLPVLEAMACGAPVITTNVSSLPEVGGDAAVYVSPNNPEQLAYEIERLLNSDTLREEYRQKGFEQCKKFSWDKTAQMTEEVYKIAYEQQ